MRMASGLLARSEEWRGALARTTGAGALGPRLSAWLETMGPQMRGDVDGRRSILDRETMEAGLNNAVKDMDEGYPPEWRLSRSGRSKPSTE